MEKRVTIRILASTHRRLRVIAAQRGVSLMQAVDEVSKVEDGMGLIIKGGS